MKTLTVIVLSTLLLAPSFIKAGTLHELPVGSPEFQKLKKLVGSWEGTGEGKKMPEDKVQVEYSLTSGGSVLVEKLFPGTPHEMVSMYHDNKKGKLSMTHYCMMGNQPNMEMTNSSDKRITLELAKDAGVDLKEAHMHSLAVEFQDDNHFTQKWTSYENGKLKETSTFTFARAASVTPATSAPATPAPAPAPSK